jgi:hypothetical protein
VVVFWTQQNRYFRCILLNQAVTYCHDHLVGASRAYVRWLGE